jgi:ribosome hibernation promoting factor
VLIEYTGRQTEVPPVIKTLAERKLRKLERVLGHITHVHVVLAADKHRLSAEVSVSSPHLTLSATEESSDLGVSLATVVDKLTRQAQRHLGKLRHRKRRAPKATALWSGVMAAHGGADGGRPRVIRSRRFVIKPMTVEEAVLEVEGSAEGFLVFREATTERMNVLFKRKDGNLGLIEPEA